MYYFQFRERGFMAVCCAGNRKVRTRGGGRGRLASRRRHLGRAQTLPGGVFWGACLRDRMAPSTKHSLPSHTHPRTHTHSQQQGGTIPPTALSPHLFLPDISIMKCTVIYVSSDSAGPRNEVLVSCMDLQTDHQASNIGKDTLQWLLPFSYLT